MINVLLMLMYDILVCVSV